MKISKKILQVITILTIVLGILFATTMVFAADSYVMPSAVSAPADNSIKNNIGLIISSMELFILLLIIIIVIWTIILIIKNIKAGKNKNQIIRHGIKNLLWIWFPEIVCFGIIAITRGSNSAVDGPSDEYYFIIQFISLIISILVLIPQILIIKDLRKNLKGVEVKAIQNEKNTPPILFLAFAIALCVFIFLMFWI